MPDNFVLWVSLVLNPIAGLFFIWMLSRHTRQKPLASLKRLAIVVAIIGLFGQAYRSWLGITTGAAPRDDEVAWWIGKDLGWCLLALYYALSIFRRPPNQT